MRPVARGTRWADTALLENLSGDLIFEDDAFVPVLLRADAILIRPGNFGKKSHDFEATAKRRLASTTDEAHSLAELEFVE
jgi:hypothetical protein